jgi:hypothetical protein
LLELTDKEKNYLVWMVPQYRAGLMPGIDKFTRYVCQAWTKDELLGPCERLKESFREIAEKLHKPASQTIRPLSVLKLPGVDRLPT